MRSERFKVMIGLEVYQVQAHQKYSSVWIATGTYMDQAVQGKGRSEASAAAAWRSAVHSRRS